MKSGRVEYLVKWQGYATKDNTWEPIMNLQGCEEAIGMFETLRRSTKMAMPPSEKQPAFMSKLDTAADAPAPSSARATDRFSIAREKQKMLAPIEKEEARKRQSETYAKLAAAPVLGLVARVSKMKPSKTSMQASAAANTRWAKVKRVELHKALGSRGMLDGGTTIAVEAMDESLSDDCAGMSLTSSKVIATKAAITRVGVSMSMRRDELKGMTDADGKPVKEQRQQYTVQEIKYYCKMRRDNDLTESQYKKLHKAHKVRVPPSTINLHLHGLRNKDKTGWRVQPDNWKTLRELPRIGASGVKLISRDEQEFVLALATLQFQPQ